jgi:hypothetical protein
MTIIPPTDEKPGMNRYSDMVRHRTCQKAQWHYMTIIPPKDEKPSVNGYRDMVRKRNIHQMKFQDGHLPSGSNPKITKRTAHFHPEPTIKIG